MKNLIYILFLFGLASCKEEPNYNPFDNQFDVSVKALISDNCDTIPAGCGYFNLTVPEGKLRAYYQIHIEDFHQVVAKGFKYTIDTIPISDFENIYSDSLRIDSIINLPININLLNKEFSKFGYLLKNRTREQICIVNKEQKDTVNLELGVYPINRNQDIERGIGFFRSYESNGTD